MTDKPKNPAAFPLAYNNVDQHGMSLRDYFAGQALAGLLPGLRESKPSEMIDYFNNLVKWSYFAADAMLKERLK